MLLLHRGNICFPTVIFLLFYLEMMNVCEKQNKKIKTVPNLSLEYTGSK